ncbi:MULTISPECIES: SDR family oxidoreductase [Pseudomonas]|uniref:SDR family oxidoreductase n=1 Tax=Pseudomonas TaxID=286 RepID=UPI00059C01F1|nr:MULTISPECIES: SDR family oxidoreductase [Pseudomonas]AMT90143.1 short-chain dehydrogenase [Pseudomonas koreensis]MBB4057279.1 hypothetical protein [Pseudomonas koreensis]TSB50241.1 SDR family oxidoreductase [Pseudomonas sp. ef1]
MKKILIIGATSAIANACARIWAAQGSEFFLVARNSEKLEQMTADLTARGAKRVITHLMDVTDLTAHVAMLKDCVDALQQIDLTLIAHGTLPEQSACEQYVGIALKELNNNGISVIALLTLLANQFEMQRYGTLAVISSVAGDRGRPSNYLYGTAKAAVSTFCEGLRARMFKVGVHVMTIKPGFVDTPMTKGLPLPGPLVVSAEKVAKLIINAIDKKKDTVYTPAFWNLIMMIIKSIPSFIFKRLNL